MRTLAMLLLVVSLALLWLRHDNQNLSRSFMRANQIATEQKNTLIRLDTRLAAMRNQAEQNAAVEQAWRQRLAKTEQRAVQREQTIARLLNENEAFRRWYNAPLPDAVRRVHQRAACASAGDCQQPLPQGDALSNARQRSPNQR